MLNRTYNERQKDRHVKPIISIIILSIIFSAFSLMSFTSSALGTGQKRTILLTAAANCTNISYASFTVYCLPSYVTTLGYTSGSDVECDEIAVSQSSGYFNIEYSPTSVGEYASGAVVFQSYYNLINSSNNITMSYFMTSLGTILYSGGSSCTQPIVFSVSQLGDIDSNGEVDSDDALLALQASAGSVTLLSDQLRRADLDSDGAVSAAEALRTLQFANGTINCLIGEGTNGALFDFPTTQNSEIISGNIYRIKNSFSNYNLYSNFSTSSVSQSLYQKSNLKYKYKIEYDTSGKYKILVLTNSNVVSPEYKLLTMKTNNNRVYVLEDCNETPTSNVTTASQRWYIANYQGRKLIINATSTSSNIKLLSNLEDTSSGGIVTCSNDLLGGVWNIEGPKSVTIANFYDYAYNARFPDNPAAYISARQSEINSVLSSVFNISVTSTNTPSKILSYGDECFNKASDITLSSVSNHQCNHTNGDDSLCSDETPPNHHNSIYCMLDNFIDWSATGGGAYNIKILSTGYDGCNYNNSTHNHNIAGLTNHISSREVLKIIHKDFGFYYDNRMYESFVYGLHETVHALGAYNAMFEGSKIDTAHGDCIMSYGIYGYTMYNKFTNGVSLFCPQCKQEIEYSIW